MAKSKPLNDPTIQPPDADPQGDAGDELQTLDLTDEVAKLRAELAAKDEQIRQLSTPMVGISDAPINFDGPKKRFVVAVQDAPTWCVEAPHESLAFDAYKRASGMVSTPHVPTVTAVHADHPLGKAPFPFPGPGDGLPK